MIDSRIGHYVIESQLGAGGMGVVYRAFDTRLERPVAIKVFSDLAEAPKARRRLLHEARSASALNHPNVCTIYEVGESGDTPYLVMEFIEGKTLAAMLPPGGLSVETVARYGAQIAAALAHAHSRGVVHRDLKCLNVIVSPEGHVKVLDFGVALRETHDQPEAATQTKNTLQESARVVGTTAYMAPEALRGGLVDRRADIWALGVVLHEMASSSMPFTGSTMFELSGQILHEPPRPLPDHVPGVVRAIVLRCLAKDPSQRYQDASEVRAALETMQSAVSLSSTAAAALRAAAQERRGILVLPFRNVASDPENEFFADGLSEEIIADLSGVRQLRVISRTSSMRLKGTTRAVAELAREMRVGHVLEGSVRRSGPALRITANLIEVATDSSLWAEKFTGTLDDVFAFQESLSRSIVQALRVVLTAEEDAELKRRAIADPLAFEWFLRAKREMLRYNKDGLDRALEYLAKSSAIVGENVAILAAEGEVNWQYVNAGVSADAAYLDRAEACARRAIELDPAAPHGHRVAGLARIHRGDAPGGLRQLRRALALDPNDPDTLFWGCQLAAIGGQMREAVDWAAHLVAIDPITPFFQVMPGTMAWMKGDFEKAATAFSEHRSAIADAPSNRFVYGQALIAAGRVDEGRKELDDAARAAPDNPLGQLAAVFLHALDGDRAKVSGGLTPALLHALEGDPQYCWFVAQCYALVQDLDAGIRWLEAASTNGFVNHELLSRRDPFLQNLRVDPRYPGLMEDVERRMRELDA